ncbi:TonB-dependent receptor [Phenylobacterium sp.]|jgi:outer membrane receptor protein involved in Fe transport|uniref:TonB-dependent receptor n=1 Tax=Phenylobacterium sp. TaxID=1871053 RepID=UPI002E301361|nr:TonB-dependent receptor [Phenylobacterium sp.]HEX4713212.1 TonB-dependent receptor [Phenylobacterium sp.]
MNAGAKLSLLAGAAFAALALPVASSAADTTPASANGATVQEVIVTAEKREENLRDVPQSVTAISGDALDARRAVTFEDYVTTVPGMNLISSQPGASRLVLRGINAGGVSATIGTYVDETPYGSVTGLANGAVLAPDLDTFDMQRVEVLRGPQGTLYGASSLGGLLKFVTNAPDPSRFAAKIEADADDTESGSVGGSVKGMINVPLGDKAAIRASGYDRDQPGYIDDPLRHAKNVDSARYSGLKASFLYHPTDKFTIRLSAVGQDITSQGTSTMDVNRVTLAPLYGDLTQSRTFAQPNKVAYRIYNATADYDFGFANLLSATSYATLRQDGNGDATAQLGPTLTAIFKQPLGAGVLQDLEQKKFTQEVRLASPSQAFEWLVGGFYTHEENALHQNLSAINLQNPPQVATGFGGLEVISLPSDYKEYAVFANGDYHFTDRFDVGVGGRYSHNKQTETQVTTGPLVGPGSTVAGASSENVFTFAVAPKFKLSDDATLYARIAKGYRPGGPNAVNPLAPATVPRTFQSDSIINYEAGMKADAFDRSVSLELTAFYITWDHIQLLANVGGFGVNTNGGSAESKGVEGAVTYVPTQGLTLSANGAYTQANLTADTPAILGGKNGDRLPYSAPVSGSLNADYGRPVSDAMRMFVGASVRFEGRRRSDFNPTFGQTSVPAYTAVDLRGGLEWGGYRAELYVKNLVDERGILSLGGIGSTPNGAVQEGLIRPRTIGLSLSASY